MTGESAAKGWCGQCGQEVDTNDMLVDEETEMLLCPLCAQEQESCGCSDEE